MTKITVAALIAALLLFFGGAVVDELDALRVTPTPAGFSLPAPAVWQTIAPTATVTPTPGPTRAPDLLWLTPGPRVWPPDDWEAPGVDETQAAVFGPQPEPTATCVPGLTLPCP